MEKKSFDHKEILEFLPHRYPFLLVDKVVEFSKEPPFIRAVKHVTWNEPFFQGHFPGEPLMPGVLILEALAQTGVIFFKNVCPEYRDRLFVLAGIDKARFRAPVYPGDVLVLELDGFKARRGIIKSWGKALVGDKVVAEAELTAGIR